MDIKIKNIYICTFIIRISKLIYLELRIVNTCIDNMYIDNIYTKQILLYFSILYK